MIRILLKIVDLFNLGQIKILYVSNEYINIYNLFIMNFSG